MWTVGLWRPESIGRVHEPKILIFVIVIVCVAALLTTRRENPVHVDISGFDTRIGAGAPTFARACRIAGCAVQGLGRGHAASAVFAQRDVNRDVGIIVIHAAQSGQVAGAV